MLDIAPRELYRRSATEVGGPLMQRFERLQALDGTEQDQDPRDGFVSVQRPDGNLQAILAETSNGVEYNARVMKDGQLVRGENASVSNDLSQVLGSHYEAGGQRARYCGPGYFADITTDLEAAAFFVRKHGAESRTLEDPQVKQWNTQAVKGFANVSILAEFPADAAKGEDYYYLHNFDLMWNPS